MVSLAWVVLCRKVHRREMAACNDRGELGMITSVVNALNRPRMAWEKGALVHGGRAVQFFGGGRCGCLILIN
jgi:hypothetical protein